MPAWFVCSRWRQRGLRAAVGANVACVQPLVQRSKRTLVYGRLAAVSQLPAVPQACMWSFV
eukprot:361987-Chlamydomonas_euryale.AAC.5